MLSTTIFSETLYLVVEIKLILFNIQNFVFGDSGQCSKTGTFNKRYKSLKRKETKRTARVQIDFSVQGKCNIKKNRKDCFIPEIPKHKTQ